MKRRLTSYFLAAVLIFLWSNTVLAAEPVEIKINYGAVSGAFAPIWLAQDEGLFAKHGLKTDLKLIGAATEVQALLGQSLHIVNGGPELIDARLGGADVAYFAAVVGRFVFSLYSKPEFQRVQDLKGKVLGATQPNSVSDFATRIVLREAGISAGKDSRILYVRGIPEIMTSLVQGVIDAGVLSPPTTLKARQAGLKELVNITEKNIPMIQVGVGSTRTFLKDQPDVVRRYLRALLEGQKMARTDAARTKQAIGKYTRTTSPEDLEETYRTFILAWDKVPYVPAAAVQTLLDFSQRSEAKSAKPEQFIDNSFLAELERSGFVEQLYRP